VEQEAKIDEVLGSLYPINLTGFWGNVPG